MEYGLFKNFFLALITSKNKTVSSDFLSSNGILAHQIEKSYVLPCVYVFLFNIGCIGRHVTSPLIAHVTMTPETFFSKMVDTIAGFFLM